ncbi:MAG: helix-turn-helix transcriptional regulator [Clostridiaceae bacterium]|nr:helix-turn-helix domain-containing protein [Eubacteriales bacterium]
MQRNAEINDRRYIEIGLKIAYYRKLNGMTQEQLAELVGLSPGYVSQVETPAFVQPVSLKTLFAIADLFHVPPSKFLEFDER